MMEMDVILNTLAKQRKVFHSEADFQHALAWELHHRLPESDIRLEYPMPNLNGLMYLDIWVKHLSAVMAIELKYKTRAIDVTIGAEKFALKNQSAQDIGRYDFIKDIYRLEQSLGVYKKGEGYAILLTNDSAYWKTPQNKQTVDTEFRLHNGRVLSGSLNWREAGAGTTKGRETVITLKNQYSLQWQDYADLHINRYGQFRYLLVPVIANKEEQEK